MISCIACINNENGIGYQNRIPWSSKEDLKYFRKITTGNGNNAVVMGYNTYVSIGLKSLPNRKTYVLTKRHLPTKENSTCDYRNVTFESNIDNIIPMASMFDEIFIIGGERIYDYFKNDYTKLYITHIDNDYVCDTFFPIDLSAYKLSTKKVITDNSDNLIFSLYIPN